MEKTGHKREESEVCMQLHGCSLVEIRDVVGQLTQLECCKDWLWALQEGQAGMERGAGCCGVFCESAVEIRGALPFEWIRSQLRAYV